MTVKIYLFATLIILALCEAKKISIVPANSHILNLVLKFNEDRIDDYVLDSFFASNNQENDKLLRCDVTLNDIIRAIPIKKLSTKDFVLAIKKLNVSFTDDDLTNIVNNLNYEDLKSMGFSTEKIYKGFVKTYFKDRPLELQQFLDILGVTTEFAVAYTFGSDKDIFNALQSVNLTSDNLAAIANIIDSTTTLKDLINILGVKKIDQTILANFINTKVSPVLFDRGLTRENLKNFLQSFDISISNYKNSKSFKNCYSSLTKDRSLAVAVSRNEIITNDDSLISKYINLEPYTTLYAEAVEDSGEAFTISADNIHANGTDNIIRIQINGVLPTYIEEANSYKGIQNEICYYITVNENNELLKQQIPVTVENEQLTISKSYSTAFKKGSPLICGQNLYGLAAINRLNAIVFDYFEINHNEEASKILEDPKVINAIKEFFGKIIENFDPCNYLSCGNAVENQNKPSDNLDEQKDGADKNVEDKTEINDDEDAADNEVTVEQNEETEEDKQQNAEELQEEDGEEILESSTPEEQDNIDENNQPTQSDQQVVDIQTVVAEIGDDGTQDSTNSQTDTAVDNQKEENKEEACDEETVENIENIQNENSSHKADEGTQSANVPQNQGAENQNGENKEKNEHEEDESNINTVENITKEGSEDVVSEVAASKNANEGEVNKDTETINNEEGQEVARNG